MIFVNNFSLYISQAFDGLFELLRAWTVSRSRHRRHCGQVEACESDVHAKIRTRKDSGLTCVCVGACVGACVCVHSKRHFNIIFSGS